ncbi:MAG: beta-ketoacyl-ACP synthase II [Planctomycetes bacterium]|nr:beta-ketoacyl-ACP synthase II [Planctomycetota bacterium]NUQ33602.1 beta-ketoacyl-ACP synthase II [Planctomycetaceae bacterium]
MSERRRVVVTGLGAITPLGNDVTTFWEAAVAGKNGIEKVTHTTVDDMNCHIGGTIKNFDPTTFLDKKLARQTDPCVHYALGAAMEALKDSGLDATKEDPYRIGVILGSGIGGMREIEEGCTILVQKGPGRMNPFFIPKLMLNAASGQIAIQLGLKGPNWSTASACASANHAVGSALRSIQYGDADVIFTGGTEATLGRLGMSGFCAARAMCSDHNDDPAHASRPFDKNRSGFVMGEGAGILVLEELEHAKKRGAKIYCEVAGYGATDDAFHITAPSDDGEGAAVCMQLTLKDAKLNPEQIGYVNAHGTSTPHNDRTETKAIRRALGAHAEKALISSTKSMIGHLLGGSGGVELVACVKTIETGRVHPTRNYETPDPECDLNYVPNEGREARVDATLKNSFGFGGHNATIALKRFV